MKSAISFLLVLSATARGGESTNYLVTPQSQTGGGRSASTDYTINTSSETGGASAPAAFTLRTGFAGVLFDATALEVMASPVTVNEGGIRQLAAALVMDDATRLPLATNDVTWSTLTGPVAVNAAGVATAGAVYETGKATVQGALGALTGTLDLTVQNVSNDNFGTYAGDGLDDAWQVLYFGFNSATAAPLLDPDNDGWTNLFEYNAGLVPTDPLSVFNVRMEPVAGQPAQRHVIFSPRLPGRTYVVSSSTTMQPGSWTPVGGATVSDNGNERTVTDPNAGGARKFYRVDVQEP